MLLVRRGLFSSRSRAAAAILAGEIAVPGHPRPKAGLELPEDVPIELAADACPFVSRGGLKLAAALDRFSVEPSGRAALDVGASTGGFTDCLLRRGASLVYAVDVGRGQLAAKLRNDPRVVVMEKTHARALSPESLDPRPDLAVVDVSFISLSKVLAHVRACLLPPFDLVALIKPQFELEARKVPRGIVREARYREEAVARLRECAPTMGLRERGLMESPIRGAKGNVELLWHLKDSPPRGEGEQRSIGPLDTSPPRGGGG